MIPDMVNESYNQGPFKLICDDFGPANVIVKGEHDLTVVGVVDLEWVYAEPAQLFASASWWLLLDRPINEDRDFEIGGPPKVTSRYFRHLEMFKRILGEEEEKMPEQHSKKISKLMTWSEDSGAMWLHMLLSSGFFDWFTFPCMQLRQRVGVGKWSEQLEKINSQKEAKEFVARKLREVEEYDEKVGKVEQKKALLASDALTREEFIAAVRAIIS
ncbi:unnamed protein product [Penicillium nalgiovense]|nr:unnamed protein product [Penicillium nalgiovense]CAG7947956.1 unnamed protein product [Penicillium nalgiovense]CAG7960665.1 unnamed protein product [Penicillium nalgiovense]CAG7964744.1 unnamed protein product [Penicillium nalgiovense]CAG7972060.1 unnamed protein product [Penicillium nalgiovense]